MKKIHCKDEEHDWKEIECNRRIQILQCQKCKKSSTAKWQHPDDYEKYKNGEAFNNTEDTN